MEKASNFCSAFQLYLLHNQSWGCWSKDTLLISNLIEASYFCWILSTFCWRSIRKGETCYYVSFPPFWLWANDTRFLIIIYINDGRLLIFLDLPLKFAIDRSIVATMDDMYSLYYCEKAVQPYQNLSLSTTLSDYTNYLHPYLNSLFFTFNHWSLYFCVNTAV